MGKYYSYIIFNNLIHRIYRLYLFGTSHLFIRKEIEEEKVEDIFYLCIFIDYYK